MFVRASSHESQRLTRSHQGRVLPHHNQQSRRSNLPARIPSRSAQAVHKRLPRSGRYLPRVSHATLSQQLTYSQAGEQCPRHHSLHHPQAPSRPVHHLPRRLLPRHQHTRSLGLQLSQPGRPSYRPGVPRDRQIPLDLLSDFDRHKVPALHRSHDRQCGYHHEQDLRAVCGLRDEEPLLPIGDAGAV